MTKREQRIRQVRRQKRIMAVSFLVVLLIAAGSVYKACNKKTEEKKKTEAVARAEKEEKKKKKVLPRVEVDLGELNSAYAILAERETGKILAEKGSDEIIYPASMTKMMTTLVAIENIKDLDSEVMYPESLYDELLDEHASFADFEPGEKVKVEDLLYGAILPSGAESCRLLADKAAGSEEAFVKKMNEKAEAFGMKNTHFTNVSGFHNDEHYTTVKDMLLLLENALDNKLFYKIITTQSYTGSPSKSYPDGVTFQSKVFESLDELNMSYEVTGGRILGGKTGYTDSAGVCLASVGEVGGNEYVLVTAKADRPSETAALHVQDAMNVYNQIGEFLENNSGKK